MKPIRQATHVVATIALLLAWSMPPAAAQTVDEIKAAFNRGDFATTLQGLRVYAEQGSAQAQYILGVMYDNGLGVAQDYAEAVRWFRLAAEQGYADAQRNLGIIYANGQGVAQDYAEAMHWYRLAAEQGFASAQLSLGFTYEFGQGVPQDFVRAHKWYNLAASRESDAEARAVMVKARNRVAGKLTAEGLAEAQRLARQWQPQVDTDQ